MGAGYNLEISPDIRSLRPMFKFSRARERTKVRIDHKGANHDRCNVDE